MTQDRDILINAIAEAILAIPYDTIIQDSDHAKPKEQNIRPVSKMLNGRTEQRLYARIPAKRNPEKRQD